ncbi:MAG: histidine--tRNA ligase [Simkaniaceae bacterium]|nr:histidine--tRNA ligase [Simkaniaceae bacterium]
MSYQIPKGLFDILPAFQSPNDLWRTSDYWHYVETKLRYLASLYGYSEIRTPIFEKTELFTRSVGDTSDIVFKEMYTFEDKGKRSMTLRPEGTAPVMRALIESRSLHETPYQKLFYFGPFFRYDRPQAGRYRQFHQFGVESIGIPDPEQDAETIAFLYHCFESLGIRNLVLRLNSIGNQASRSEYCKALKSYLEPHKSHLSEDSQARLEANPLRILDSKDLNDIEIIKKAPSILDCLDSDSAAHFSRLQQLLNELRIPFKIEHNLVRGLDYYNKTVFEFTTESLGAQNTIGAGGRYDGLIEKLGGAQLPAIGFAVGIERLLQILIEEPSLLPPLTGPMLLLLPMGDDAKTKVLSLSSVLRKHNVPTEIFFKSKKVQKALQHAEKIKAQFFGVLGEDEIKNQSIKIKHLSTRDETLVPFDQLPNFFERRPNYGQS